MDNNVVDFRAMSTMFLSMLLSYFQSVYIPLFILTMLMILDYLSGIARAYITHTLSSRIGYRGIVKKISYYPIVAVSSACDYVVHTASNGVGVDASHYSYFGLVVIVWLMVNECISILENVDKIGVPVPKFLEKLLLKLEKNMEEKEGDSDAE